MTNVLLMYVAIVVMGGILSTCLSVYAFFKLKDAPGGKYFILATSLSAAFTFAYACELASTSLEQLKFWLMMEYFALPFIPVFILLMCLEYTSQKPSQWIFSGLFVIPVITIFMHNTNELHHFYYSSVGLRNDTPFPILKLAGGPWFYVHSLFLYLCIAISIIVLLLQLKKSLFRFRMQILMMVAGLIVPIVGSIFYINGMSPYGIDLGPVFMSVSFVFHGVALLSFQMFNVAPIARDTVFESMEEGVIVLNQNKQIVDYNDAAAKILPTLTARRIGKPLISTMDERLELKEILTNEKECDYQMVSNGRAMHVHIRFSDVKTKGNEIVGKVITFSNITERVVMEEKLKLSASLDGLTKIYNRTFFLERSEEVFESFCRSGGEVAVLMFDIDYFKKVNDTLGHEAGDAVLVHIANVAKETIGTHGMLGRYGGEEFVACLPGMTLRQAYGVAELIRLSIAGKSALIENREVGVTLSLGVSSASIPMGTKEDFLQPLMRQADQALYAAKKNGRNRVELYGQVLASVN